MIIAPRQPELEFYLDRWRDVSADVRQNSSIVVTAGRKDWASKISPSRCMFTLDDGPEHGNGAYDPDNPLGAWFGRLSLNTPLRYSLRYGADEFDRANQAGLGTSPTMGVYSSFSAGSTASAIAGNVGTQTISAVSAFRGDYLPDVLQRNVEMYAEWTIGAVTVTGGTVEPANLMLRGHTGGDYWLLRIEISTTNDVFLRIMFTGGGTIVGPLLVGNYPAGGADMGVRFQAEGATLRGKVWQLSNGEPLAWQLETTIINETLGAGWVGVRSGRGSTNTNNPLTVTLKHLRVRIPQFIGETSKLEPVSTVDHGDMRTNVEAGAIRRRLSVGEQPLQTAFRRYITRGESPVTIVDYWPMDQDGTSDRRAINLLGGPDARFIRGPVSGLGAFEYGFTTSVPAIPRAAQLSTDGRLAMPINAAKFSTANGFGIMWLQKVGSGCRATVTVDLDDTSQLQLVFDAGAVNLMRNAVSIFTASIPEAGTDTSWHMIGVGTQQSGGNIKYGLSIDERNSESTVAGTTARPTQLAVFADAANNSTIQLCQVTTMAGYLYVFPGGDFNYTILRNVCLGRPDEHAGNRFTRLCLEEGIPSALIGAASDTPAMGPQTPQPVMKLIDECVDVDQGSAFDPCGSLGLGMRTHRSTTARTPLVTLDYVGQVAPEFKKTRDDQGKRNDITAKRPSGGEYRVQQLTGPSNVADPGTDPDAIGRYDSSVTTNVAADVGLPNQAGWRVHLGTVAVPRFATLTVKLFAEAMLADPAAVSGVLDLRTDDAVTVTGAQARRTYDDVRLIVRGYTSTIDTAAEHTVALNCEPYQPLDVGVHDATDDRYDTLISVLTANITSVATSFSVTTNSGEPWTTAAGAFPFDVMIGGERIRIASVTGATSPQTFNVAAAGRAINGVAKAHGGGEPVSLFRPVYHGN